MRKYKSNYLKPYIRRLKRNDLRRKPGYMSLQTWMRLGLALEIGYKYVMVQRGNQHIMLVGKTKNELKRAFVVVRNNKGYNMLADRIKNATREKAN